MHAGHLCQALPPASHAAAHDRARYRFALSLPLYSNKILSMNRDSSLCSVASRVRPFFTRSLPVRLLLGVAVPCANAPRPYGPEA